MHRRTSFNETVMTSNKMCASHAVLHDSLHRSWVASSLCEFLRHGTTVVRVFTHAHTATMFLTVVSQSQEGLPVHICHCDDVDVAPRDCTRCSLDTACWGTTRNCHQQQPTCTTCPSPPHCVLVTADFTRGDIER